MKGKSLYKIGRRMGNLREICRRHYAALTPESLLDAVDFDDHARIINALGMLGRG
jgi:hypothetical protein